MLSVTRLALLALLVAVAAASLEVRVRVDKTEVVAGEPLTARVSMLNAGSQPLTLLTWFTPLEGASSDMFRLMHIDTARAAVYKGRIYKRHFPAPIEAYTTLAAGEARHVEIDLADSYHFLSDGAYQVSLVAFFSGFYGLEARLDAEAFEFELEFVSPAAALSVRGASPLSLLPPTQTRPHHTLHPEAISYIACSSTQQSGIKSALPIAQSDATQAYNYMVAAKYALALSLYLSLSLSLSRSLARSNVAMRFVVIHLPRCRRCNGAYVTWFGTSTSSRYSTVQTNWNKIVAQLKSNNYRFDCSCDKAGTYAYVYPFDPTFTIYLCRTSLRAAAAAVAVLPTNATLASELTDAHALVCFCLAAVFWTAPTGSHQFNSRPGTLTHETSHFKAVAGTDDIQYGEAGCKRLATTSPNDAIKNADSYEFFQESNPKC
mgnify:FL=1